MQGPIINDRAANSALNDAYQRVLASPDLKAATAAWAACMSQAGYQVSTLADARKLASGPTIIPKPTAAGEVPSEVSALERAVATGDIECEIRALLPVFQRLELAELTTLAAQFPQYAARAAASR